MSISSSFPILLQPFKGIDPKVVPNDTAPWMPFIRTVAGWVLTTSIVILVIVIIAGAVMFAIGKISSTQGAQALGSSFLIWGFAVAIVIGSVSGLVLFFTSQSIAPATTAGLAPVLPAVAALLV